MAHSEPLALLVLLAYCTDDRPCCWFSHSRILEGDKKMLFFIVAVLVVLWFLGLLGGIAGGAIHLLLVVAVVLFLLQLFRGRRTT